MMDYASMPALRQRASARRDEFDQERMKNAQDVQDRFGLMGQAGSIGAVMQTRMNLGRERAMAEMNPQWDAWFQALEEATGQRGGVSALGRGSLSTLPNSPMGDQRASMRALQSAIRQKG